jgi:hypothetical protein
MKEDLSRKGSISSSKNLVLENIPELRQFTYQWVLVFEKIVG